MNRISTFWTWALALTALLGCGLMSSSALSPRMARIAAAEAARPLTPPGNPMTMEFFMPGDGPNVAQAAKDQVVDGGDDAGGGANPEIAAAAGAMAVSAGGGLPGLGFSSALSFSPASDDRLAAAARSSIAAARAASAPVARVASAAPSNPVTPTPVVNTPTITATPTPATTPNPVVTPPVVTPPVVTPPVVTPPVVDPPIVNPPIVDPPIVDPPVVDPPANPNPDCPTDEPCDGVVIPGAPTAPRLVQSQESVKTLQSRLRVLLSGGKSSRSTNPALSSIRQANIERVCEQLRLRHFHHPDCNDLLPNVHR